MFVWPTAKKVNAINTSNGHFGYFCFVFSLYGSSMKHFECWMWRVSSFYTVVQIAKFSEGRIYRHTLITMKCGHWYPGIFHTHRQNSSGMCVCVRVNTHIVTGCFSGLNFNGLFYFSSFLLLFTHNFQATFHSSVFLRSTKWSKNTTNLIQSSIWMTK